MYVYVSVCVYVCVSVCVYVCVYVSVQYVYVFMCLLHQQLYMYM